MLGNTPEHELNLSSNCEEANYSFTETQLNCSYIFRGRSHNLGWSVKRRFEARMLLFTCNRPNYGTMSVVCAFGVSEPVLGLSQLERECPSGVNQLSGLEEASDGASGSGVLRVSVTFRIPGRRASCAEESPCLTPPELVHSQDARSTSKD